MQEGFNQEFLTSVIKGAEIQEPYSAEDFEDTIGMTVKDLYQ